MVPGAGWGRSFCEPAGGQQEGPAAGLLCPDGLCCEPFLMVTQDREARGVGGLPAEAASSQPELPRRPSWKITSGRQPALALSQTGLARVSRARSRPPLLQRGRLRPQPNQAIAQSCAVRCSLSHPAARTAPSPGGAAGPGCFPCDKRSPTWRPCTGARERRSGLIPNCR